MSQFLGTRQPHIFGCSIFTRFIYGIYGIIKPITSSIDKHVWSISTSRVWSKTDFEVIRHPLNRDRSGAANWIYILELVASMTIFNIAESIRYKSTWQRYTPSLLFLFIADQEPFDGISATSWIMLEWHDRDEDSWHRVLFPDVQSGEITASSPKTNWIEQYGLTIEARHWRAQIWRELCGHNHAESIFLWINHNQNKQIKNNNNTFYKTEITKSLRESRCHEDCRNTKEETVFIGTPPSKTQSTCQSMWSRPNGQRLLHIRGWLSRNGTDSIWPWNWRRWQWSGMLQTVLSLHCNEIICLSVVCSIHFETARKIMLWSETKKSRSWPPPMMRRSSTVIFWGRLKYRSSKSWLSWWWYMYSGVSSALWMLLVE